MGCSNRIRKFWCQLDGTNVKVSEEIFESDPWRKLWPLNLQIFFGSRSAFPLPAFQVGRKVLILCSVVLLLSGCSTPQSTGPRSTAPKVLSPPEPYVRLCNLNSNLVELQIAIRQFVPARGKGPTIWLTAVSH